MRVILLVPLLLLFAACPGRRSSAPRAPEASPPEPIPSAEPLGTAHPLWFLHSPPGAHWLVVKQDRDGNGFAETTPSLLFGPGPGERIGAFCGSDPRGRYLVILRDESSWLIDSYTRTETRLGPRPDDADSSLVGSGSAFFRGCAQFSADGRRFLFLRPRWWDGRLMIVVREVEGGAESVLNPGQGLLDSVQLEPTGQWVLYELIEQDTDGDGHLNRGNPLYVGARVQGDSPVDRVLRADGRPPREPDSFLGPVGRFMLRRGSRGELLVEDASGRRTEWVPAECGARILHVDTVRELLVVACMNRGSPSPVELHGQQVHQALGVTTNVNRGTDELFTWTTRLVTLPPVYPHIINDPQPQFSDTVLDLERRTVHPMSGQVLRTHGTRALVLDAQQQVWLVDVERGERTALGEGGGESLWLGDAGGVVLEQGLLVDLEAGRGLGRPAPGVLAVDSRGRVLRHDVPPVSGTGLGPVRWHPPPSPAGTPEGP